MRLFLDPRSFPGIAVGWEGGGDGDFLAVEFEVVEVCHGDLGSLLCGVLRRQLVAKQGEEMGEGEGRERGGTGEGQGRERGGRGEGEGRERGGRGEGEGRERGGGVTLA